MIREIDGTLLFVGWGNAGSGATDNIYLFRYKNDGTFLTVQSDDGTESIDLGGDEETAEAALVPNTQNVVVAGSRDHQMVITRFADRQAFGDPDKNFAAPAGYIVPALGGTALSEHGGASLLILRGSCPRGKFSRRQ